MSLSLFRRRSVEPGRIASPFRVPGRDELLRRFREAHDPTQGNRQGNDVGSQYRSAVLWTGGAQLALAEASRTAYTAALREAGRAAITTQIAPAGPFSSAEPEHQQYLHKVPGGYCGLRGTGVACAVPTAPAEVPAAGCDRCRPGSRDLLLVSRRPTFSIP